MKASRANHGGKGTLPLSLMTEPIVSAKSRISSVAGKTLQLSLDVGPNASTEKTVSASQRRSPRRIQRKVEKGCVHNPQRQPTKVVKRDLLVGTDPAPSRGVDTAPPSLHSKNATGASSKLTTAALASFVQQQQKKQQEQATQNGGTPHVPEVLPSPRGNDASSPIQPSPKRVSRRNVDTVSVDGSAVTSVVAASKNRGSGNEVHFASAMDSVPVEACLEYLTRPHRSWDSAVHTMELRLERVEDHQISIFSRSLMSSRRFSRASSFMGSTTSTVATAATAPAGFPRRAPNGSKTCTGTLRLGRLVNSGAAMSATFSGAGCRHAPREKGKSKDANVQVMPDMVVGGSRLLTNPCSVVSAAGSAGSTAWANAAKDTTGATPGVRVKAPSMREAESVKMSKFQFAMQ